MPVVTGTTRDEAALNYGVTLAVIVPKVPVVERIALVLSCLLIFCRSTVDIEHATTLNVDSLARTLGVPHAAVAQCLVAIEHVTMELDGVGVARRNLNTAVALGVPIGQKLDGHRSLVEWIVTRGDHVIHNVHDILDTLAVEGALVLLACYLANGARRVCAISICTLRQCYCANKRHG